MESQTVVTARLSSGTRITIDTGPYGSSFVDLVGAENVRVDLAGSPARSYVVIHAKHGPQGCTPIDLTDCTVALSLGHAMAIGEVAAAEMARLADHVQQEAREHRDAEHTIPASTMTSTMTLYARAHHLDPADLMACHTVEPEWVAPVGPDPYGRVIRVDGSDYSDAVWPMAYLRSLADAIKVTS